MKIGLDFDGVITDCAALKSLAAQHLYNKIIPPHLCHKEIITGGGILTAKQYRRLQWMIYESGHFDSDMRMMIGALYHINQIQKNGDSVEVITSRKGAALNNAQRWARKNDLHLKFTGVGVGNSKADAAEGLDLYVDDDADKLIPLIGVVPNLRLFSYRRGDCFSVPAGVGMVDSWKKLYRQIQEIKAAT